MKNFLADINGIKIAHVMFFCGFIAACGGPTREPIQLGVATVSWDIPTTNAEGWALIDLAGFNVYYGQISQTYTGHETINDKAIDSALIKDLEPGTWFFTVTAIDLTGNESIPSTEVSKVVTP